MNDAACVGLLRWALPHLGLRWQGFRKVRRSVCRRVARRLGQLGLADATAYRRYLEANPAEWGVLDGLCRITISRFYRDRRVFDGLRDRVLPALARLASARADPELRCWSAGCGCGEEAYTLSLIWALRLGPAHGGLALRIVATDVDETLLARGRRGRFRASSLRDLPPRWRDAAFAATDGQLELAPRYREAVAFRRQDLRQELPEERFHLILCRNLAFTYFDDALQRRTLCRLLSRLLPGGALVIGSHETLPASGTGLARWPDAIGVYRRVDARAA